MKIVFFFFVTIVLGILGYVGYSLAVPPEKQDLAGWSNPAIGSIKMKTEINFDAPVIERQEIFINARPSTIFNTIKNITEWPKWQSAVTMAEAVTKPAEGTDFNWATGMIRFRSEFHTLKKFKSLGWTGTTYGTSAVHNWRFENTGNGTKVYVEESLEGWFPMLFTSYFRNELRTGMRKNLEELKAACEKS